MKQICPVCEGRGIVPPGFYLVTKWQQQYGLTNTSNEKCRTCNGEGVIES